MAPDNLKVRITEDPSLAGPIAAGMIQMNVPSVREAQARYEKWFGAKLVKHGQETVAEIPGSNILFVEDKGTIAGTKGRAFDRLGLEVKNVEDFRRRMEASGHKLDGAYRKVANPWGTYIDVSEGLAAVK